MRYISIDPATKSIAVVILDHNGEKITTEQCSSLKNLDIIFTDTTDLAPGIKNNSIEEVERINLMINYLNKTIAPYIRDGDKVIIERQISGTKTYINFITLCTYFRLKNMEVIPIAATLKNTLSIGGERPDYRKYSDPYTANKEHSRSMFKLIKDIFTNSGKIKYIKKYERDLSDCFTQLIAVVSTL